MPPNYRQQQGQPISAHERRGFIFLVGAIVACAIGLGAWVVTNDFGKPQPKDCVTVTIGGPTGGGYIGACGAKAKPWCRTESTAAGETGILVTKACRKAGDLPR